MDSELVDILKPPAFVPCGAVSANEAIELGYWLGTFNLWIVLVNSANVLDSSVLFQQRAWDSPWEPGKLDVSAGGHYKAGESGLDGLREVEEELGRIPAREKIHPADRRLNVSVDAKGRIRNTVVTVFVAFDDGTLYDYRPNPREVAALVPVGLPDLLRLYTGEIQSVEAEGVRCDGTRINMTVTTASFPTNWDNYHARMVRYIERLVQAGASEVPNL